MAAVEEAFVLASEAKVEPPGFMRATVEGHVDGMEGGWLRGWVWYPDAIDHFVVVEAWQGEHLCAAGIAASYRADLAAVGKRDGYCGFELCLIGHLLGEGDLTVRVRHGDGSGLHGGVIALSAEQQKEINQILQPIVAMPLPFGAHAGVKGMIDCFSANQLRGWIHGADEHSEPVEFALYEQGRELAHAEASLWRPDLADLRQGEGSCGFEVHTPASLCDGNIHILDVVSLNGRSLLHGPLSLRIKSASAPVLRAVNSDKIPSQRLPIARSVSPRRGELKLTVIVNFYNMSREAQRTLFSLTRTYQSNIDGLAYEVLCIDNGSQLPLEKDWVESFGPEFRLILQEHPLPSPCSAINAAAMEARGEYLAIMIDGAHVLTPGVLHEAMDGFIKDSAGLVAVRHWFIGGDQRWLATSGYTREMEDKLFSRIHWPKRGYDMFRIGAPIGESHDPWFAGLSESNCLFLPAELYARIGGMDEAFSSPGAGYANLDLLRRAFHADEGDVVCLLGEATFHQYHEGTTTNVADDEKDVRVRAYAQEYRHLRGEDFKIIDTERMRLRGSIRSEYAISVHQRPLLPMTLGVTPGVRRGMLPQHFTEGARQHLQSVYAECALQQNTRWLGHRVDLAPADIVAIQDIVGQIRPGRIIVTEAKRGLIRFLLSILDMNGLSGSRIVAVGDSHELDPLDRERIFCVDGAPGAPDTLARINEAVGAEEAILVLFTPVEGDAIPSTMLRAYADFVSYRSYLIFLGTVLGQPWLGYSNRWYLSAIRSLVASDAGLVIDHSWDQQIISFCPSGYLRRVRRGCTVENYDPSINKLDAFEVQPV